MTSNLAGIEPPFLTGNRSFPLPPSRTASHDHQHTPRSWPRQTCNSAPNAPASSQDASEPALKRQKIRDADTSLIGETLPSFLDTSHVTNNKAALLANSADSLPDSVNVERKQQSPLFPIRPGKTAQPGGHQQGRALAIERANARDVVPVKPYVPEPPSFAPRFHKVGKHPSLFAKAHVLIFKI